MLLPIRGQYRQGFPIKFMAFLFKLPEDFTHLVDRVKDHKARYKMVIFDDLSLLVAVILCNYTATAEGHPLGKTVEGLALIRDRVDRSPQLSVADIGEQKDCADDAAKLPESEIDPVFYGSECQAVLKPLQP